MGFEAGTAGRILGDRRWREDTESNSGAFQQRPGERFVAEPTNPATDAGGPIVVSIVTVTGRLSDVLPSILRQCRHDRAGLTSSSGRPSLPRRRFRPGQRVWRNPGWLGPPRRKRLRAGVTVDDWCRFGCHGGAADGPCSPNDHKSQGNPSHMAGLTFNWVQAEETTRRGFDSWVGEGYPAPTKRSIATQGSRGRSLAEASRARGDFRHQRTCEIAEPLLCLDGDCFIIGVCIWT